MSKSAKARTGHPDFTDRTGLLSVPLVLVGMPPNPVQGMPPNHVQGMPPHPMQGMPQHPVQGMPPHPVQGMPPHPVRGMPPNPVQGMPPHPERGSTSTPSGVVPLLRAGQHLCSERGGQVSLILQIQFGLLSASSFPYRKT